MRLFESGWMTKIIKKRRAASVKGNRYRRGKRRPDHVLQGTEFDVPLEHVFGFTSKERARYITKLLDALAKAIRNKTFSLKMNVPFKREMRDLRRLLYAAADQYLFVDEKTKKRNVLGKGSPGSTHVQWSRTQIWRMKTKSGDLSSQIKAKAPILVKQLDKLFDPKNDSMALFRESNALRSALRLMEVNKHSGTAFPPFHAKFFADKYLPKNSEGIIVDPCAGWGGRLIGSLLVNRTYPVRYYGIDPAIENKEAYDGLNRRVDIWLKKELTGPRDAIISYKPFEDWIASKAAKSLMGKVDLVITSPPYFSAEDYNPKDPHQSTNRYPQYLKWREGFYRVLMQGAYDLLKPMGVFVLNIADVSEAPYLERDARKLAAETGFVGAGFYKFAMTLSPTALKAKRVKRAVTVNGTRFRYEPVFVFRKPSGARSKQVRHV
jgi:hypothetical protein